MPCASNIPAGMTLKERMDQIQRTLKALEGGLTSGSVRISIGANGAIVFQGWTPAQRNDVSDLCAYRALSAENSWALRQAVARAEAQAGRKVNPNAVAAGWHSHDAGATWSKH